MQTAFYFLNKREQKIDRIFFLHRVVLIIKQIINIILSFQDLLHLVRQDSDFRKIYKNNNIWIMT